MYDKLFWFDMCFEIPTVRVLILNPKGILEIYLCLTRRKHHYCCMNSIE